MTKPVNYLAQTGALEDLIWSIMNDAESEAHLDRLKQSILRDVKFSEDSQQKDELLIEAEEIEKYKNSIREARYLKTKIALGIAQTVATEQQNDKYSCTFKHQLLSMAEMRDAAAAIVNQEFQSAADNAYEMTVNNAAMSISKFLGLKIESCMACLFEKNKIESMKES